jgi:hypothetical protein
VIPRGPAVKEWTDPRFAAATLAAFPDKAVANAEEARVRAAWSPPPPVQLAASRRSTGTANISPFTGCPASLSFQPVLPTCL